MMKKAKKMIGMKQVSQICENVYEVSKHAMKITEKYPIQAGLCVLHLSKLIMLEFVIFLYDTLIQDSFEFIYTGKNVKFRGCRFKLNFKTRTVWQ